MRSPSRSTRYGITCLKAGSPSISGRGRNAPVGGDRGLEPTGPPREAPGTARPARRASGERRGPARRRSRPRSRSAIASRASRSRVAIGATSGIVRRGGASRSASQPSRHRPDVADRGARATPHSSPRSPAPISTSPRARRVMSRHPLAASRRTACQSSRRSPSRAERHRLTSAARKHERQVADRRDGGVMLRRGHPDRHGARRPRPATRRAPRLPDGAREPGTTTHGRPTNRSASAAP